MNVLSNNSSTKIELLYFVTLELVEKFGFHGTSMSMISKESGIAIGTIYHYFSSKDDLLIQLLSYAKEQSLIASFGKDDTSKSYYERFKSLWKNLYFHLTTHPKMLSYISQFYSSPYSKEFNSDSFCYQSEFKSFIIEAQQEDVVKSIPPEIISSIFLGSVVNSSKQFVKTNKRLLEEDMDMLIDTIWNGIKK